MAPRANWKGFLRLSLVTCLVALYPATSESEKISFNQLNRQTGHRISTSRSTRTPGRRSPTIEWCLRFLTLIQCSERPPR